MACQPKCRSWVDETLRSVAAALWPPTCVLCGRRGQAGLDLCADCDEELPRIRIACRSCGSPFVDAAAPVCRACARDPPDYDVSCIPFVYEYPLDHLIQAFKYAGQAHCGRVLASLLSLHLQASRREAWPAWVLPVPLAERRFRERGFNQAIELAVSLRDIEGLTVRTDVLVRSRETLAQASLGREGRRGNVCGAFDLLRPMAVQHVAILDDVVTTGSTANEIARLLRRAGAARIEVWAIARVPAGARDDDQRKMKSSAMPMNTAMPK